MSSDTNIGSTGESTPTPEPSTHDGSESLNALKLPAFRLLWGNTVAFSLVMNTQRFTFLWLVLDVLDRSEGEAGVTAFAIGLPVIFLSLQAGALADRVNRRVLLIVSQGIIGAVSLVAGLFISSGNASYGSALVLALVAGCGMALGQPVRSALVPAVVGPRYLLNAIALNAVAGTVPSIVGPALAEVIGDASGLDTVFYAQAGTSLVGLLFIIPLPIPRQAPRDEAMNLRAEIKEALGYILGDRFQRKLFLLLISTSLSVGAAYSILIPPLLKEELGRDPGDAGRIMAVMGLGLAISSLYVMRRGDMDRKGEVFQRAVLAGSVLVGAAGLAPSYGVLMIIVGITGLTGGFFINMSMSLIQGRTPAHLMGRVMSLHGLSQMGLTSVGGLVGGALGAVIGLRAVMVGFGVMSVLIVLIFTYPDKEFRELA